MTGFNHALTGAVIAGAVKQPLLAIPLAFLSHFVLDAVPHFGFTNITKDVFKRNKLKLFKYQFGLDAILLPTVFIAAALLLKNELSVWIIWSCMLAAICPDFVWAWRFAGELKTQVEKPKNWFNAFHAKIQWSETTYGAITEIIWSAGMVILILIIRKR